MSISRWLAICAAATLAACTGASLNSALPAYNGQPASALMAKLGTPTSQEENDAGRKAYIWYTALSMMEGTTNTRHGEAYGTATYACRLRVFIDEQDIITGSNWEGTDTGCAQYAASLGQPGAAGSPSWTETPVTSAVQPRPQAPAPLLLISSADAKTIRSLLRFEPGTAYKNVRRLGDVLIDARLFDFPNAVVQRFPLLQSQRYTFDAAGQILIASSSEQRVVAII